VILIAELRGSLNLADGGELAQNLSNLYEYMVRQLLLANVENDANKVTEVLGLLNDVRGAWIAIGPEVRKAAEQQSQSMSAAAAG
jgi:flagellar secretion chaperone FliS